ncbi:MAG TPA: efflux RND transporter periplasmic adaptor subunit, partial [Polyangiaceae bacterium]|nr:efflux RND transporter periplasmic adaptor subunit [Polyangiaceae bacterium]
GQGEPTLLTTVSRLDEVKVRFPISEQLYIKYAAKLATLSTLDENRPGTLQLILADGSVYPQKGRLVLVDRAVRASVGSIMLESRFPNPGLMLRPGQFARVRVLTDKLPNAIAVPQRAVIERQSVQSVLVAKADGTVESRIVQTGPRVGSYWVILKGLKSGEKVLVEGQQKVKAGDKVKTHAAKLDGLTKGPTLQAAEGEAAAAGREATPVAATPAAGK